MGDVDKLMLALARGSTFAHVLRTIVVPNPAAGADIAIAVPGGSVWRPLALKATLVTSAVVANRVPNLSLTDGNAQVARLTPGVVQAATTTAVWTWAESNEFNAGAVANGVVSSGIPAWALSAGYVIGTTTGLIDVGDQWSGVTLWVDEVLAQPQGVHELITAEREAFLLGTSLASEGM